jgi:hypothetical protein
MYQDFPRPPLYRMPHTGQIVTLVVFGGMSLALLVYALWLCRSRRSVLPVLFFFGGWATLLLEPVADVMGNAVHSQIGQYEAFSVKGHPVPWHIVLVYPAYFGAVPILLYDRFRAQNIPKNWWWRVVGVSAIGVTAIEQLPLHFHLWHYYGPHGLSIGYMPIMMIFPNIASVVVPALVIYKLMPILTGWRQLVVLGLMPAAAMGAHAAAGVIGYDLLGQNTYTLNKVLLQAGAFATVALALLVIWGTLEVVYARSIRIGEPQSHAEPVEDAARITTRAAASSR